MDNQNTMPMLIVPQTNQWTSAVREFMDKIYEVFTHSDINQYQSLFVDDETVLWSSGCYTQPIKENWISCVEEYLSARTYYKNITVDINVDRVTDSFNGILGGLYVVMFWMGPVDGFLSDNSKFRLVKRQTELLFTYKDGGFKLLPVFNKFVDPTV